MSLCRIFFCVVGRGCLLCPVCSLGKTINLCPASFCTPRPNLPVNPGISWLPTFAFRSPIMKGHIFGVLLLEGLVCLHRIIQLQLLQCYWLGHRFGLLWYWMVCLGNEQKSFCCFWDYTQVLHFELKPRKDVVFIIGGWNAKAGSQEIPGATGKFGLGGENETGQKLTEFCQENALVTANTLFQQHKKRCYTWTSPDGQRRNQIDYILWSLIVRWRSTIQSAKTRLSHSQLMNSLLTNSDWNWRK